jgi:hypothetical protein
MGSRRRGILQWKTIPELKVDQNWTKTRALCLEIGQFVQYVILRKAMETHLAFDDQSEMEKVCGINDSNLPILRLFRL